MIRLRCRRPPTIAVDPPAPAADDNGVPLPAVECPRCAARLALDVRECPECGAAIGLAARSAQAIVPEVRSLRRWLAVLAAGTLLIALIFWDHYSRPTWAVEGRSGLAMALPYLTASALLAVAFLLSSRFPLAASLATLVLYLASWGSTWVLDPSSGIAVGPAPWVRAAFLFVVLRAVHAGYSARQLRHAMEEHLAVAAIRR